MGQFRYHFDSSLGPRSLDGASQGAKNGKGRLIGAVVFAVAAHTVLATNQTSAPGRYRWVAYRERFIFASARFAMVDAGRAFGQISVSM
jgi:hypothetical protein